MGKIVFWAIILILGLTGINFFCSLASNTGDVVKKEFFPDAMLKKYEWFKDASAELDKKRADIELYKARLKNATTVDRIDREQKALWQTELLGVQASYNSLAAEYNSQMSKFNWRFANQGTLPAGADKVLPREYSTYVTE